MDNKLAYWSAGGASARGGIKRIFYPLVLAGMLLVFLCALPKSVFASDLTFRGVDLTQISPSYAKGFAFPGTVGTGVFDFQVPQWGPAPVGAVAPGSWLFFDDVVYATANSLKDANGNNVPDGLPHKLDQTVNLAQAIWFYPWQPNPHILPFSYLIFPTFSTIHVSTASTTTPAGTGIGGGVGAGGIGDILWEPFGLAFLFTDSPFAHYFKVQSNAEFFIQFPTGNFSKQDAFNPGSNVYGFLPLTETWIQPGDYFGKWLGKLSWNFDAGYFISTGNNDFLVPNDKAAFGNIAGTYQTYKTGQVFIWDNDFWYNFYKGFSLGLTVNWLEQTTADTLDGSSISNTEQSMISVGPSAFLSLGNWSGFIKIPFNVHTVNFYSLTEVQATVAYFW